MEQIRCISRKIAKGISIIIKARKSIKSETLLNLYKAISEYYWTIMIIWSFITIFSNERGSKCFVNVYVNNAIE